MEKTKVGTLGPGVKCPILVMLSEALSGPPTIVDGMEEDMLKGKTSAIDY